MKSHSKWYSFLQWLPVCLIFFLFAWSTYTYIFEICVYMVPHLTEKVIYIIFFSFFLLMSAWSYIKATFTQTAKVPYQFFLTNEEVQLLRDVKTDQHELIEAKGLRLRVQGRTMQGGIRYCAECKCIKPDRAHHCSACQRCILKMDHHCPWINNCVCYTNYKFFFLFLFYSSIFCLFISTTSLQYFIKFWQQMAVLPGQGFTPPETSSQDNANALPLLLAPAATNTTAEQFNNDFELLSPPPSSPSSSSPSSLRGMRQFGGLSVLLNFVISVVLLLALGCLFFFHCNLVACNLSTLESMRAPIFRSGPDKKAYDKGVLKNVVEVFGRNPLLMFLPLYTDLGDGITFTPRISPIPAGYRSLDTTNNHNNNNQILINSSVAMTPFVLTEVVAVQPESGEGR